jgi:hypothetical protein
MTNFCSQQLPSERENVQKTVSTNPDNFAHFSRVESGLEFILSHFKEPLFPRTISRTAVNRRQYEVQDKDTAMLYFQGALWEDCRISAFGIGQRNPDLIFIDLDLKDFKSMRAFKLALTTTLKNIKQKLGGHPACFGAEGATTSYSPSIALSRLSK